MNPTNFSIAEFATALNLEYGPARAILKALEAMGLAVRSAGCCRASWRLYVSKPKDFTLDDLKRLAEMAKAKLQKEVNDGQERA